MAMQSTQPKIPVVASIKDIPQGDVISAAGGVFPMTDDWRRYLAVISTDDATYLVVSESKYASPQMFQVKRQIKQGEYPNPRLIVVAEGIIEGIYEDFAKKAESRHISEDSSDVEKFADEMISSAARSKTSDIHIELRSGMAQIYFRINGSRILWREVAGNLAYSVAQVLFHHADSGSKDVSWNAEQVMDAVIEWEVSGIGRYQLRFSSAPIFPTGGFHVVIRLLSMNVSGIGLDALGYTDEQRRVLDIMITGANGIVLMCGPTNSGKSTTLQALMQRIYARRGDTIKMITVEDPVEYIIPGACQISVGRKKKMVVDERSGSAFTTFLRGTLRQDPDVVMVGEIRDYDSASVVKDLVLAGRKIIATLHTYSAIGAFMRLREIGVPWEILTMPGFISGIVYQRLVPVLCPECSIRLVDGGSERLPKDTLFRVQQVSDLAFDDVRVRGDGCSACRNTGIKGRTVCAEIIYPDAVFLDHLVKGDIAGASRYWRKMGVAGSHGGVTALAHGLSKMRVGMVSPVDIEEQIAILTNDIVHADDIVAAAEVALMAGEG